MKVTVKHLRNIVIGVVVAVAACTTGAVLALRHPDTVTPAASPTAAAQKCELTASGVLGYINAERAKLGAPQLTVDPRLITTSGQKISAMIAQEYYGHDAPDGVTTLGNLTKAQGIYGQVGEDVDGSQNTDEAAWQAFKNSPPHYASLTDPTYRTVGISVACNLDYVVKIDTAPQIDGNATGDTVTSLVVVHLAQ